MINKNKIRNRSESESVSEPSTQSHETGQLISVWN